MRSSLCSFVVLIVLSCVPVLAQQDSMDTLKDLDFTKTSLKQSQVQKLSPEDLKLLRGIIFGRHGRVFKDNDIKSISKNSRGTSRIPTSKTRCSTISSVAISTSFASPKLRSTRPFNRAICVTGAIARSPRKLGKHSGAEWKVLLAEVEAIHGKRFDDEPWLQQYFDERYWYFPNEKYDAKKLSAIERKNLEILSNAQKRQRKVALLPGDMQFFENKAITEQMLHGLSLHELRLLRNEVYARHGRMFRADWLQQYFYFQPWYNPDENFKDESLSGTDKLNVETIVKYENRMHQELSTKPISKLLLEGLFIEDASQMRQEIYARHGKVFKESWLQKYFSSFDWYKADPNFTEASLTEVEKKNIATIAAYEKRAVTAMSTIEG